MCVQLRDLSVLSYANGFTLWHYQLRAACVEAVEQDGYLTPAGDILSAGDLVLVSGTKGGRIYCIVQQSGGLAAQKLS